MGNRRGLLAAGFFLTATLALPAQRWQPEPAIPPLPVALYGHSIGYSYAYRDYVAFAGQTANGTPNFLTFARQPSEPTWRVVPPGFPFNTPPRADGRMISSLPERRYFEVPYSCLSGGQAYYMCRSHDDGDLEVWTWTYDDWWLQGTWRSAVPTSRICTRATPAT